MPVNSNDAMTSSERALAQHVDATSSRIDRLEGRIVKLEDDITIIKTAMTGGFNGVNGRLDALEEPKGPSGEWLGDMAARFLAAYVDPERNIDEWPEIHSPEQRRIELALRILGK